MKMKAPSDGLLNSILLFLVLLGAVPIVKLYGDSEGHCTSDAFDLGGLVG